MIKTFVKVGNYKKASLIVNISWNFFFKCTLVWFLAQENLDIS